ncbi:hypothetical protein GJ496_001416 [Pomphorhynchus laevis]|nr:hypothetical protein GJ496_001416 [Pomphorhynchus laevis]
MDYENFDFLNFKTYLESIFFTQGSEAEELVTDMNDFWQFVDRYQASVRRNKTPIKGKKMSSSNLSFSIKLPSNYMEESYDHEGRLRQSSIGKMQITEFKTIIELYLQFLKTEKRRRIEEMQYYQNNLPIASYRQDIIEAIKDHNTVIIAGDTGCGKSTQVPRYLIEEGFDHIVCTQPRRLACVALAKRVSEEMLSKHCDDVAFQVRFDKTKSVSTKLTFMTEGILMRMIISDPQLSNVNIVLVDEVHERHLSTDFLLGVLRCLLVKRHDLKIVLMSATMNFELFHSFFGGCFIFKIPGRLFQIALHYRPQNDMKKSNRMDSAPYISTIKSIQENYRDERGDLLIFVSGLQEISSLVSCLRNIDDIEKNWIVLPLHGSLSLDDQEKVFHVTPPNMRKCIVSTNIAETSMTIDGIRFVIDSGKVKQMMYDTRMNTYNLKQIDISKASAEQRKGRAGRTGPGVCFRLYSQQQFNNFSDYTLASIHRSSLDQMILEMYSLGLPDINKFPFVEKPPIAHLDHSISFLYNQGAIDKSGKITILGRLLARLPVDIKIGKALIYSSLLNICNKAVIMAAILSISTIFTGIVDPGSAVDLKRRSFCSDDGDLFIAYSCLERWLDLRIQQSNCRDWCKKHGIEEKRLYEIIKLRGQFENILLMNGISDTTLQKKSFKEDRDSLYARNQISRMKRKFHFTDNHSKPKLKRMVNKTGRETGNEEYLLEIANDLANMGNKDIDQVEFELANDATKILQSMGMKGKNKRLLRILLAWSFYPQFAIADRSNSHIDSAEFLFHTKNRQFISIHPSSLISLDSRHFPNPQLLTSAHTLLYFETLLETNKPYMLNIVPVPAFITCLMTCNDIATDDQCQILLFDGWIRITRETIKVLIAFQLSVFEKQLDAPDRESIKSSKRFVKITMQNMICEILNELFNANLQHSMERIVYTRLADLFKNPITTTASSTADQINVAQYKNENRGGIAITNYLEYNCLLNVPKIEQCKNDECIDDVNQSNGFTCRICNKTYLSFSDIPSALKHCSLCPAEHFCVKEDKLKLDFDSNFFAIDKDTKNITQTEELACPVCGINIGAKATSIDMLRHMKTCHP